MTKRESMSHDEAIELLPWLVNESLDAEERQAVAKHATACVICRRELGELEALHQSIQRSTDSFEPPAVDMRRINARIDAQLERENRGARLFAWMRESLQSPWRIVFVAQSLALVAIAFIWLQPQSANPPFETLTTPRDLPAGNYVRVVFDPTVDAPALSALLQEFELNIADGPTDRGVYTLQISEGLQMHERDDLAVELRSDERVLFAEIVAGGN